MLDKIKSIIDLFEVKEYWICETDKVYHNDIPQYAIIINADFHIELLVHKELLHLTKNILNKENYLFDFHLFKKDNNVNLLLKELKDVDNYNVIYKNKKS
jgi:hypothetical protein